MQHKYQKNFFGWCSRFKGRRFINERNLQLFIEFEFPRLLGQHCVRLFSLWSLNSFLGGWELGRGVDGVGVHILWAFLQFEGDQDGSMLQSSTCVPVYRLSRLSVTNQKSFWKFSSKMPLVTCFVVWVLACGC